MATDQGSVSGPGDAADQEKLERRQQEQMLKLVTKGFYNELVHYGVKSADILTIASHLLDHVMQQEGKRESGPRPDRRHFTCDRIRDEWRTTRSFTMDEVTLHPLEVSLAETIRQWLEPPKVRGSFVRPYPERTEDLQAYFRDPSRFYFAIDYQGEPSGIIGAENLDPAARILEMRKLVGNQELRGKGIGKRATFTFLYYVFRVLGFEKVYIHSTDVNIRNINLNSLFGFELEGLFLQDIPGPERRQDVVRMGLLKSRWMALFESEA